MEVKRDFPENIVPEHKRYFEPHLKIDLPTPGYRFFRNYILLLSNGILMDRFHVDKQSLLYDKKMNEKGIRGYLLKCIIKSFLKRKVVVLDAGPHYVTIINQLTNNYFHWFTEAIPKLICLLRENKKPIVLLPAHYDAAYQLRSLELLGFPFTNMGFESLVVKNLYLPDRLAPYTAQYNPAVMKEISDLLKSKVDLSKTWGPKIYLSRRKATQRKLINEEEVINLLKEYEFSILELEQYSLDQQISLMHNAEIFVSMHGAGLTNMIFCKPGTKVLELCLENQVMDKCYFNLANAMKAKYYYQFCKAGNNSDSYLEADLSVSIKEFIKNIQLLTNDSYRTNI
jgi:capsular polysaccharide biosynthesis protein